MEKEMITRNKTPTITKVFNEWLSRMRVLLYSGLLYLLGVAIVLAIKPAFMFTRDGGWKEFGIGRNPERYTWMPLWLFTIFWAILSFFLVQLLGSFGVLPGLHRGKGPNEIVPLAPEELPRSKQRAAANNTITELKPGYYMLNTEGTAAEGVPRYVYVGPSPE